MNAPGSGSSSKPNWPKDEFGRSELIAQWWFLIPLVALALAILAYRVWPSSAKANADVIAYCAQDQTYAEPIFREFEKQTGIKVRAVYDNEAVKTVGLANRLLAESSHPQCDVFWGNEELRTRQLAARNVFRERHGWAAFGYRSRRLVINTNKLSASTAPHWLSELTNVVWRGKVALANPQFGTTATHFQALRQYWGGARWENWCRALAANKPLLVDGNSVVVKFVAQGEALVGLTDSDDIADGQREGLPVAGLALTEEMLLIPNTVGIVRNAQHPETAERLFEYLQRPLVIEHLVSAKALEGLSMSEVTTLTLKVNWEALQRDLEPTTAKLNEIFLR